MAKFRYTARDMEGKVVKKYVEASNYADVYDNIEKNGLQPIKILQLDKQEKQTKAKKLSLKTVTLFCRQFGSMLSAGIPLVKAFDILSVQAKQTGQRQLYNIYGNIYQNIQKGMSLNECMRAEGDVFPPMLVNMVRAGEASGNLDIVIDKCGVYFESQHRLKNKIKTGLLYPKILLVLLVVIVVGLFTFILPKFFVVFDQLDVTLPAVTQAVIAISDFFINKWLYIVIVVVAVWLLFVILMTNYQFAFYIDQLKTQLPIVRVATEKVAIANFSSTMAVLYGSGVSMLDSLEIASSILNNKYYEDRFKAVIKAVESGKMLSAALEKEQIFEPMFTSLMFVGEEAGNLEHILQEISVFYMSEAEEAIARMVTVIEPVILVIIGVLLLVVIAAVIVPSFSLASQVTEKAKAS